MRNRSYWYGASALLLPSLALGATVLERTVRHTVEGQALLRAVELEKIRLDSDRDLEVHAAYVVLLDEHIELERVSARATKPGGDVVSVDREEQDERQITGPGELHSSARYHVAPLPALPVGTVLDLGHEVTKRVYFPAESIVLRGADAVESLRVEVRGAAGLRWILSGPGEGIEVEQTADGLTLTAANLPGIRPQTGAPASEGHTTLHYAWGPRTAWRDVGQWFEELTRDLPRGEAAVTRRQSALGADAVDEWDRLSRLVSFCQKNVRYVAVEVGVGGFRPSPPAETLERQWGDCKDKSFLLLDLLGAAGIEAYPALILGAGDDRIDPRFPTPFAFNHLIVALPVREWMGPRDLPISDGYLFVDPTQTHGGAAWLGRATQGQHALIVRGADSALVRTPVVAAHELRRLVVELRVEPPGTVAGTAELHLTGSLAAAWESEFTGSAPEIIEGLVRDAFDDVFPGGVLADIVWNSDDVERGLPVVDLRAAVRPGELVEGEPGRYSFLVSGQARTPEPGLLADRRLPVQLLPHVARSTWTIRVPGEWCVPEDRDELVENPIGAFRQRIDGEPGVIRVERDIELRRRWVEPDELDELRELSLAEHRALKRRIRADCSGG